MLRHLIGHVMYWLRGCEQQYRLQRNNAVVHNRGSTICAGCELAYPDHIYIGKDSYINGGHIFASKQARITIGDRCMISYCVHLRTDMHNYLDPTIPMKEQGFTEQDIKIGNDVWIGYGAQIMSGVTVADGCVIGAGAVVTKNTEPYGVYVGAPAHCIKHRTDT